jgi:hypothetical protein
MCGGVLQIGAAWGAVLQCAAVVQMYYSKNTTFKKYS